MLPLINKKITVSYKIKVKCANYKIKSGTASKLFETISKPSLQDSGFKNTDKRMPSSMLAYKRLKAQKALCLNSKLLKKKTKKTSKLLDMYLTEFEDTLICTDFSYTDNTLLILLC